MHETRDHPRSFARSVVRLTAILLGLALVVPFAVLAWYLGTLVADLVEAQLGVQYGLWFQGVAATVFVLETALVATLLVALARLWSRLVYRRSPRH